MTDRYTNTVLTVIAVCLIMLVLEPFYQPPEAHAQAATTESAQASQGEVLDVNIVEIGGWPVLSRAPLPVEIDSGPVPVLVQGDSGGSGCGCH